MPTNRTDYGIRALIYLANHRGSHAKAADIGSAMGIPTGFLQQVLQELQRARLVSSRSGPSGGYLLAHAPEDITILEIVETLEGPIGTSECALPRRSLPLGRRLRHALGLVLGPDRVERQPARRHPRPGGRRRPRPGRGAGQRAGGLAPAAARLSPQGPSSPRGGTPR